MSVKLTVKTLKGEKFQVDVEPSNTVGEVKGIVETAKSEMPAEGMKLIHSGKILKDDDTIESCNIKPSDFLVVMVSKKKTPAPAPAAAPAAAAPETPAAAPASSTTTTTTTPAETPATNAPSSAAAPPAPSRPADNFSDEAVATLTAMGFPDAEVRHCLRAANGNPDVAVEFLTNGIPPGIPQPGANSAATPSSSSQGASGQPLQALREHPQFDALRRLVQSNPQMLQQVLTQIGQQQPELLTEINANQALFLQMMNEPVTASSSSSSPAAPSGGGSSTTTGGGTNNMSSMMEGMANPQQMAQMLQNMNPQELQQMATMMGMSPEQLQATAQMIGQIPPDQLQNVMQQAMQQGGMPPGMMGGGPQVLRLNEEEMAAVDRLTEMGFDRAEAAQAFLACDKNEALAANLLMDSAGQEGGVFGFQDDNNNNDNSGGNGGGNDNDGDDMYD